MDSKSAAIPWILFLVFLHFLKPLSISLPNSIIPIHPALSCKSSSSRTQTPAFYFCVVNRKPTLSSTELRGYALIKQKNYIIFQDWYNSIQERKSAKIQLYQTKESFKIQPLIEVVRILMHPRVVSLIRGSIQQWDEWGKSL